jgi:aminoglycoside phosphotransferase (APT) family kinase protein
MTQAASRAERTEQMRRHSAGVFSPEFIARRFAPLCGEPNDGACSVEVVRLKGTRFTVCCAFPSGAVVYAKAYGGRQGPLSFATLRRLWNAGFDNTGSFRVPEPLGFLEDENVVLMRQAKGQPLSRSLTGCSPEAGAVQVRAAARWLLALHTTAPSGFEREGVCERPKILKETDILAEAASAQPSRAPALLEFVDLLHELAQAASPSPPLTPTHGQFTPSTVFIDSRTVTAVDLDTVAVSDPAKDVATMIGKLKYRALFRTDAEGVQASRLADEFLDEYTRHAPGNAVNLPYYLALYCVKEFAKFTAAPGHDGSALDRAERLCRAELRRCRGLVGQRDVPVTPPLEQAGVVAALQELHIVGQARLVQAKPTGRLTFRLTTESGECLYAKGYADHLAGRCARVSAALRAAGLGANSPYRVPEVAAFLPDRKLLVMRAAEGVPLATLFETGNAAEALRGSREAARWLTALHRCGVESGHPEHEWISLKAFRVPARLIRVCASFPEHCALLPEILYQLKHCVERLPAAESIVQTHGSFRAGHVFVDAAVTTAIDLDRSRPADAAKDAAEFAADLRAAGFDRAYDPDLAEQAAEAFLYEYLSQMPELEARVACYTACYLTLRLLKNMPAGLADAAWAERFESYREAIGKLCRKRG